VVIIVEIANIETVAIAAPTDPKRYIRIISRPMFNAPLIVETYRFTLTLPKLAIRLPLGTRNVPEIR
jgi:hypothetical protein